MALRTLSTNQNMNALLVGTDNVGSSGASNVATLMEALRGDPPGYGAWPVVNTSGLVVQTGTSNTSSGTNRPRINQAFTTSGILIIPNRGWLQCKPGDFVAYDTNTGWPILISGDCAANGNITHT